MGDAVETLCQENENTMNVEQLVQDLCNQLKLKRDSAVSRLEKAVEENPEAVIWRNLQNSLIEKLKFDDAPWEQISGCLAASKVLLTKVACHPEFTTALEDICMKKLTHDESRVRLCAGECMGSLCRLSGVDLYCRRRELLFSLLKQYSEQSGKEEHERKESLPKSAGWSRLETTLKCLQAIAEGCGESFLDHVDSGLFQIVSKSLNNPNRFVREAGFFLLNAIIVCAGGSNRGTATAVDVQVLDVAGFLKAGLADNWSQVRMAASRCCRDFLPLINRSLYPKELMELLAPPMCLNRYYLAEGVRLYSQETWRLVTEGRGVELVTEMIEPIAVYYEEQTTAENHAVREAACHAIAELGTKIRPEALQNSAPALVEALVSCFQDESWPVRDAACIASATFLAAFPELGRERLQELLPCFWKQLEDCIPSVRQGAAEAIAKLVATYGAPVSDWVNPRLVAGLEDMQTQPLDDAKMADPTSQAAVFGVVKRVRDNDPQLHTDQPMFSCGSLAPKMGRGGGGCSDHSFTRPPAPWEKADGCVQLLAELSGAVPAMAPELASLLPRVIEACRVRHFVSHVQFLETVCRRVPQISAHLGKKHFKPHLQSFLEPIFYSLTVDAELTRVAAEDCVRALAQQFGPSILRGRVEMTENMDFLRLYDNLGIRR